jgi:type IX secretion system PorP/SprF family membrane protein
MGLELDLAAEKGLILVKILRGFFFRKNKRINFLQTPILHHAQIFFICLNSDTMKIMFTCLAAIGMAFFSLEKLSAQQFGFYSMYQKNWQVINPAAPNLAFIQSNDAENILNVSYRQQWIGVKGAPVNYNAHFETMIIDSREKLSAKYGFGIYGESAGALLNNTIYFNYAYPLTLEVGRMFRSDHKLYLGFNAGYFHQRINFNSVRFEDNADETIENLLREQKFIGGQSFFELSPGLFYTNTESFYIGLSSPRLVTTGKVNDKIQVINAKPQIHLMGGFYNEERTIQPSIWLRWQSTIDNQSIIDKNPISATFNFRTQLSKALTLGLGVSTSRWIHFEGGWQLGANPSMNSSGKPITISFAYDLPFYPKGLNLGQTAEINLTFFL